MKKMSHLRLHDTAVTDAGLDKLRGLPELRRLDLWRTRATDRGVERLREAIPGLVVITQVEQ
jgi:hypothetical protein